MQWLNVAPVSEFKQGSFRVVDTDDFKLIVTNCNGEFYAILDVCTHDGGTLSDGEMEGCEIICPRHGARFDLRTGEVTAPPAYEDIQCFPTRIVDDMVQVGF